MNRPSDSNKRREAIRVLVAAVMAGRKNPTLILNMDHVTPVCVTIACDTLKGKKFKELDVILHTPGGHIESAFKIAKLLRTHADKVNIIIPAYAKSAGTLLSMAGDSVVMGPLAELGPLDVQLLEHQDGDVDTFKSALNGHKALEQIQSHAIENLDVATALILRRTGNRVRLIDVLKLAIEFSGNTSGCLYSQLHPKTITEYARALDVGEQYGVRLLVRYLGWDRARAAHVVRHLVYDYPSHGFIIDAEEFSGLGFTVEQPGAQADSIDALARALAGDDTTGPQIELLEPKPGVAEKPTDTGVKNVTNKPDGKGTKKAK